jgi:hypothetical protein
MASPLTGATLTAQKAVNRWKEYFLAISSPNTIFTARINQTFSSLDGVAQLTYDGGSGTYTNVRPGMLCKVGSAAGLSDIAAVRVRAALSPVYVYIAPTSGAAFANDQHLTFVDDFPLCTKDPLVSDTVSWMDYDIAWSAPVANAPIVRIGPAAFVLEMTGATVAITFPAPTIYSPSGATAVSYLWTAPSASATSGLTTSTPTMTYNAAGEYYISCAVTDSDGGVSTVYRKIFVNPTSQALVLGDMSGDVDSGYWECRIEGYSGLSVSTLPNRALCVLWRKDYVSTARATSYGPYTNSENVRLVGRIDPQSVTVDDNGGLASFSIKGPGYWLDKINGAPLTLTSKASAANWNEVTSMNTDKALYRLIKHQSTLADITDVTLTGDTTAIALANVNSGTLFEQINSLAGEKLMARLMTDPHGCAFVTIPPSLLDSSGKSANTVLVDYSSSDLVEQVEFDDEATAQTSQMEIGGASYDGTTEYKLYSRAPGNNPLSFGMPQAPTTDLALANQTDCNRKAGDLLAIDNSEYKAVDAAAYWPNDYIGYAMARGWLVRLSIAAADNPRGIVWTTKRFAIESAGYAFDPETGAENTELTLAEEVTGVSGVAYYPPSPATADDTWDYPFTFPALAPFKTTWFPNVTNPGPITDGCGALAPNNVFGLYWDKRTILGTDAVLSSFAWFPCKVRDDSSTYIIINAEFIGDAASNITVYALDENRNRVLTGAVTSNDVSLTVAFSPASETNVSGFELALAAGTSALVLPGPAITYTGNSTGKTVNAGTAAITTTGAQVGTNLIRLTFDSLISESSTLFANQTSCTVNATCASYNTPLYYGLIFTGLTGGSGNRVSLQSPTVLNFTVANVNQSGTWSDTGSFTAFSRSIYIDNKPEVQTGVFNATGTLYIGTGYVTNGDRKVIIGVSEIFNVCQAD